MLEVRTMVTLEECWKRATGEALGVRNAFLNLGLILFHGQLIELYIKHISVCMLFLKRNFNEQAHVQRQPIELCL